MDVIVRLHENRQSLQSAILNGILMAVSSGHVCTILTRVLQIYCQGEYNNTQFK